VPAWSGCGAAVASCGERHSAVLLRCGRLLLCGDGVALAHALGHHADAEGDAEGDDDGDGAEARDPEAVLAALELEEPAVTPRLPCANFFPWLEGKHLALVACGGQHTVAVSRGELLGLGLGTQLLSTLKRPRGRGGAPGRGGGSAAGSESDDGEASGDGAASGDGWPKRGWAGLGVPAFDCVLLAAGARLGAHKAVLARRSRVLRELIAAEERPPQSGAASALLELLVPELKADTAHALREFLYTDQVASLPPGSALPLDLLQAAERFELPRLAALAKTALPPSALPPGDAWRFQNDDEAAGGGVPASSLASDLGSLLGDRLAWADVKFVAGGRAIYAHRTVLAAASAYFRAMFRAMASLQGPRSGNRPKNGDEEEEDDDDDDDDEEEEEGDNGDGGVLEVVVPDSYVGMLRVLGWVYTGKVDASGDSDAVLEDLIAADRFQLVHMKRACESLVEVDAANCVAVLEVATVTNAPRLAQVGGHSQAALPRRQFGPSRFVVSLSLSLKNCLLIFCHPSYFSLVALGFCSVPSRRRRSAS
jgi:hypothetical protein